MTDHFSARHSHALVVVGSEIYLIVGLSDSGSLNDVWKSADGRKWTQITAAGTRFPGRNEHRSVVFGNAIYVIGGLQDGGGSFDDVWKLTDGGAINVHAAL